MTQIERYIIRKLLDIDYKVSSIQEHQRNINTKIDYIQNQMQTFGSDDNKTKKKDKYFFKFQFSEIVSFVIIHYEIFFFWFFN